MNAHHLVAVAVFALAAPAAAGEPGEIGYPKGALGYDALVAADYSTAESQILASTEVARNDPARLINLGQVFAKTGRPEQAERMFEQASNADEIEIVLADGRTMSSREAARRALRALRASHTAR